MSGKAAQYRKIVVGIDLDPYGRDLTEGCRSALRQTERLAALTGASVIAVHSTALDEHWTSDGDQYLVRQGASDAGRNALEAAIDGLRRADIEANLVISEERAWLAVIQEAIRRNADLVVVGKRTTQDSDGRRIGSVSRKLLHDCPGPVWVVRPGASVEPRVILASTDLCAVGSEVVQSAAKVAGLFDSELHIVHAISLPLDVQFEGEEAITQFQQEKRKQATDLIRRDLEGYPAAKSTKLHIGITSPTQAVLQGERDLCPDLIVMGTVSRGGIPGFFIGNTAERLLGRLETSILTVKPDDFVCPVTAS